jgi:hypothetical protein
MDARAFASPKGLRPRRRVKPAHDEGFVFVTAPALQRTLRKSHSASTTRVNALMALRRVRGKCYFGSGCTGSTHSTVSGFSTGSMSRLIATA